MSGLSRTGIVLILALALGISSVPALLSAPPLSAQDDTKVVGGGPAVHQSPPWNLAGMTGEGVKVGVIDLGFEGITDLLDTELPAMVEARCYTDIGVFTSNLSDCETKTDHGTAVTESLLDIAPGVAVYVAKPSPGSLGDLAAIADWMVDEGVSVINYSADRTWDGPGDGTSPFSNSPLRTVDRAIDAGVLWVNAASNTAETTWFEDPDFIDGETVGFNQFAPSTIENFLYLEAGDRIVVQLRWDDTWGGSQRDLDVMLWAPTAEPIILAGSFDRQQGREGDVPYERFGWTAPLSAHYSLSVSRRVDTPLPGWLQLMVFSGVGEIEHHTKFGSITNPGESANPGMLAVGASPVYDTNSVALYSSRGPTPDGRIKPEVVAADCGETATYAQNPNPEFCGTSQAAPHVAGMAALVLQRFPGFSPVQVADYLKEHAVQRIVPDPNNTWGHGFAVLPPPLPPSPPVQLASSATGPDWASVSWTFVTESAIEPITSYDLRYIRAAADSSLDSNWTVLRDVSMPMGGQELNQHRLTGLMGGTSYLVQVRASNIWGPSEWTHGVPVVTSPPVIPEAPTELQAALVPGESKVELSWMAPVSSGGAPITGYRVESSPDGNDPWTEVFTVTGDGMSYTDDGADGNGPMFEAGSWPYYRVAAINSVGPGPFTAPTPAGDPLIVRYDANNNGTIERGEVIAAINDYLDGVEGITRTDVIRLINLYLDG